MFQYFDQKGYNSIMLPVFAQQYKLVLVGDSSVGKSSLLCQLIDGKFDQNLLSTIGVDFKFKRIRIGKEDIKLQIWDTAGQQTFRSIVSAYYNSADGIVLCYDITNYVSFDSLKSYWLPQALANNKANATMFVVGTKLDGKRQVQLYSLDSIKQSTIHSFFQVSAKQNINVEKCFIEIGKVLHSMNQKSKIKQSSITIKSSIINQVQKDSVSKSCCK